MCLSIYLHVPFCSSRCVYCAFYSGEPAAHLATYPGLLQQELDLPASGAAGPVSTVYFGGGTPSLLPARSVANLLRAIDRTWGLARDAEITLEANPGDTDCDDLRSAGVNRLSLGVQALDNQMLAAFGRRHTTDQVRRALETAQRCEFPHVSADLLFAVPGLPPSRLGAWVGELAARGVQHLSAYSLEVHPGTPLAAAVQAGTSRPARDAEEEAQYQALLEAADRHGYQQYELSNFALAGHRSRHNQAYWEGKTYLGLGPGAHSYLADLGPWGVRSWNDQDLQGYAAAIAAGEAPPGGREQLNREEALLERLFLAFRRPEQIAPRNLAADYRLDPDVTTAGFSDLAAAGLFTVTPDGLQFTPNCSLLRRADGVAAHLHERLLRHAPAAP